jgi:hypothetical protein
VFTWIPHGKRKFRPAFYLVTGDRVGGSERAVVNSSLISDLVDDVESVCLSIFTKGARLNV